MKENNTLYLDNTMLQAFNKCPKHFYWRHIRHLVPKGSTPTALLFGSSIHLALETLYKGGTLEESICLFENDYSRYDGLDGKRTLGKGIQIMKSYYKMYFPEYFKVLQVESGLTAELSSDIMFVGRADLIVELKNGIYIMEHKTSSSMHSFNDKPNHQMTGYTWAVRELGYDCKGVIVNILGVYKTKEDFLRKVTTRTEEEITDWKHWVMDTKLKIDNCLENSYFPMYTGSCWNCTFVKLCASSNDMMCEAQVKGLYEEEVWKPWDD